MSQHPFLHDLFVKNAGRGFRHRSTAQEQIERAHNYGIERHEPALTLAVDEQSHITIARAFGFDGVNKELGQPVKFAHANPPMSSNSNHARTSAGTCIRYFADHTTFLLRTASCAISKHSTFSTCGQPGVAA